MRRPLALTIVAISASSRTTALDSGVASVKKWDFERDGSHASPPAVTHFDDFIVEPP
jgi:hypothetical protein